MKKFLSLCYLLLYIISFVIDSTTYASYNTNLESIYDNYPKLMTNLSYIPVRVLLSTPKEWNYIILKSDSDFKVLTEKKETVDKTKMIAALYLKNQLILIYLNKKGETKVIYDVKSIQVIPLKSEQPITVVNWNRTPAWDTKKTINDNVFLGGFDIRYTDNFLNLVNEINLQDYMRGIAEVPENDQTEKRKALQVISRSYVYYYISQNKYMKFSGKHYNASDDPNVFQKYKGYSFTLRSPKWQEALKDIGGEVITYNDKVLRAAYFSCTQASGYTKSPKDANWTDEYFGKEVSEVYKSIEDKIGVDPNRVDKPGQCGHGVGLSGFGATKLAESGWTYKDILKHYYQKISFKKIY